ncbi:chorismate lyase [Vibrio palustris]|uniref:Probable chorismate pyruvate-lyase n=1 Tax=Vibrio palustris TaxID=1918946 RepID=A0A1R4B856_9VIBR|nr:chorismate lyase [Vibrio palustris]SJL85102.1 Chorismate pyruvate-lyase [Vibrio palustris]
MNKSISLHLSDLCQVYWHKPDEFTYPNAESISWLQEMASLSQRLAQDCHQLKVKVINNQHVAFNSFRPIEHQGLPCEDYWVRDVVLCGDDQPWVIARTLIPLSMLENTPYDLAKLGNKPLGLTVFNNKHAKRDQLEVGYLSKEHPALLARRSRLWMDHHAMLVSEIFLPESPIYK